jgi:hypothetical protein
MAILPTSAGVGVIFHPRVRPSPAPWIGGCRRMFHFSLVGDTRISELSDFVGFGPASSPKFPSGKFWPSPTISHTHVRYCNPRCHSSYSSTLFFSWCSNPPRPRDRIHLHFAQTRGWPETRWVRAWVWLFTLGCDRRRIWMGATSLAVGGFLSNPPRTRPLPSLLMTVGASPSSRERRHANAKLSRWAPPSPFFPGTSPITYARAIGAGGHRRLDSRRPVCHRAAPARGEFSRRARLAACRGLAEAGFSNGLDMARALFMPFSFSEILYSFKYSKNSLKRSTFI